MQINSLPILNSESGKEKIKTIGVPTLIASTTAFIASKAPKNASDTVKFSKRLGKATTAGLITAVIMAILTTKKEDLGQLGEKVKMGFNNLKNKIVKPKENAPTEVQNQTNIANQIDTNQVIDKTPAIKQAEESLNATENQANQLINNPNINAVQLPPVKETTQG